MVTQALLEQPELGERPLMVRREIERLAVVAHRVLGGVGGIMGKPQPVKGIGRRAELGDMALGGGT